MKVFKKILLTLAILFGVLLLCAAALFTYLTITEFRPEPEQPAELYAPNAGLETVEAVPEPELVKNTVTVLSWNVGYCGLGKESDFFMDGGEQVHPLSEELVHKNFFGISKRLMELQADFLLLQEVDSNSDRSAMTEESSFRSSLNEYASTFALNFSAKFVPYPWPPIGMVNSGLQTLSRYGITEATRISLPCPFSWPVSMVNLKRCLLVTRIPLAESEKELVLVNLHLEAYDDGEGKLAQSEQLRAYVEEEYAKGNYVVAGGDWNQIFPKSEKSWPNTHKELWTPGYLDERELSEGWRYVWDASVPTCRLLNQPYDPKDEANTQYYVIDGFLISPNLKVEKVETLDEGFEFSDHNPVFLTLSMGE